MAALVEDACQTKYMHDLLDVACLLGLALWSSVFLQYEAAFTERWTEAVCSLKMPARYAKGEKK
eukprot:CAMPEP_0183388632 /NCGR_PEP_ID=MMETSP0370-20130417/4253_1 /TAXON_ID=268820 /ORGANISM="Peridinium aciculiferum, Strain PAER-2" /LENGTH=63 /DNA_ID=CAMNT_0025567623 /DNA_START=51 /DNA_END=239 /DNA_ORIENTATION=-